MRPVRHAALAIAIGAIAITGQAAAQAATPTPMAKPAVPQRAFAAMPAAFVPNHGQTDARVRYYALGNHYAIFATRDELMLSLTRRKPASQLALALRFIGRNCPYDDDGRRADAGQGQLPARQGPAKWQTKLTRYRGVVYHELWPHIDLRLHQKAGVLKYEFRLRPGARVSDIRLAYAGATGLALGAKGALRIKTGLGVLRDAAPVSYQRIAGKRVPVRSRFVLRHSGKGRAPRFAFAVGRYRHDRELIDRPGHPVHHLPRRQRP